MSFICFPFQLAIDEVSSGFYREHVSRTMATMFVIKWRKTLAELVKPKTLHCKTPLNAAAVCSSNYLPLSKLSLTVNPQNRGETKKNLSPTAVCLFVFIMCSPRKRRGRLMLPVKRVRLIKREVDDSQGEPLLLNVIGVCESH